MNYAETLDYLYTKLPMYSRIGDAALKPSLDNTIAICAALDHPEKKFKSIHIAGTNGKGSVSHMLASVLQAAGYKTGLYTSPHLKDFRERIKINGEMISEAFVIEFTERMQSTIASIEPSFFELTVGMAFDYFSKEQVDIAIIETGLGGRLDSTNVITPVVSVITNIGWDHQHLLGDTLEKIATEKAGIIKEGVPVVVGEVIPETRSVFEYVAAARKAPLHIADEGRQAIDWNWEQHHLRVSVSEAHKIDHDVYHLDLAGIYQLKNLLTVLETIHQLAQQHWSIDADAIHIGLSEVRKKTGLRGRWEIVSHAPAVIMDVAHNVPGIQQVLEQLEMMDYHQLHIVLGMVNDKDIESVLRLLPSNAQYYFTQANIPRALPAGELLVKAQKHQLYGRPFTTSTEALRQAKIEAKKDDLVLVMGSIFLVGELLP